MWLWSWPHERKINCEVNIVKKLFSIFVLLLLAACVPPAEELAGVSEEPVEEVEVEEVKEEEAAEEEVKEPVEEVKEEVKNETINQTATNVTAANITTNVTSNVTNSSSVQPVSKEYFTGAPISIGEGETKIIVVKNTP